MERTCVAGVRVSESLTFLAKDFSYGLRQVDNIP